MLELKKKNIHMDCIKAKAGNMITIEDDINIPDLQPDIDKVIFQSGSMKIEEVKPGSDQVTVKGALVVRILYQSEEDDDPVGKIETTMPIDELLHMDGIDASDSICMKYELEDLSIGIINSRKISVRASIDLELLAREIYDEPAVVDVETSLPIEYRKKPFEVLETTVCQKDIFRFRHEETLPAQLPNILEVLYEAVEPIGVECIPDEGKLMMRGNIKLFFLYSADDTENNIHYYETVVPMQGEVVCSGLHAQIIPCVGITLSDIECEVKDDYDGENRIFVVEAVFDLDMKAYEEKSYDILADMYCVTKDIKTECKDATYLQLLQKQQGRVRIKEKIELDEAGIISLVHHEENVTLEDVEIEDGKMNIIGNMQLRFLYMMNQEMPRYHFMERDIPFVYIVEGIDFSTKIVHQDINLQIAQADIAVIDEKSVECNAMINLNVLLLEEQKEQIITEALETELQPEQIGNLPGMVIYVVKEGDSLWKIGKEYYISVDEIKKLNDLEKDDIYPGDKLILIKNCYVEQE